MDSAGHLVRTIPDSPLKPEEKNKARANKAQPEPLPPEHLRTHVEDQRPDCCEDQADDTDRLVEAYFG